MKQLGLQIVVVSSGFVYVGQCYWDGDFLQIQNAQNLRVWGTTRGLGELINGPTKETKADPCGTCLVPKNQVILFMAVEKGW